MLTAASGDGVEELVGTRLPVTSRLVGDVYQSQTLGGARRTPPKTRGTPKPIR